MHFICIVCIQSYVYVCARDLVLFVFAMLCMKMFVNFVCFVHLYTIDLYNYGYLRIVKHFEFSESVL